MTKPLDLIVDNMAFFPRSPFSPSSLHVNLTAPLNIVSTSPSPDHPSPFLHRPSLIIADCCHQSWYQYGLPSQDRLPQIISPDHFPRSFVIFIMEQRHPSPDHVLRFTLLHTDHCRSRDNACRGKLGICFPGFFFTGAVMTCHMADGSKGEYELQDVSIIRYYYH